MKKTKKYVLIIFVYFIPYIYGCNSNDNGYRIDLSKESIVSVDLSVLEKILLQTTDESMLYNIEQILPYKDCYLIQGKEKLCLFNSTGHYVSSVSRKGRGPGEFINLSSCYIYNDKVHIYSLSQKLILSFSFSKDSNFIYESKINIPDTLNFSYVLQSDIYDGRFFTHNAYDGIHGEVMPVLSVYDSDFNEIVSSEAKIPLGGRHFAVPFSSNCYGIVFTDFLNNKIFTLSDNVIDERFFVDFKNNNLPRSMKSVQDKIDYLTVNNKSRKVAVPVRIEKYKNYILFKLSYDRLPLLAVYNLDTGNNEVFRFIDKDGASFIYTTFTVVDDWLLLPSYPDENTIENPAIYKISLKNLLS